MDNKQLALKACKLALYQMVPALIVSLLKHVMFTILVVVVVISQFHVPSASLQGYYGVDIPAFHGGGRPQVPLRAIFRLERAPG
jgi:hypothetical protein